MAKRVFVFGFAVSLCAGVLSAQIDPSRWLKTDSSSSLGTDQIVSGLKEALEIGTGSAVSLTGVTDGYFGNAAIKILMPEKLKTVETGLRAIGYGGEIDAFVLSMNRAAESAAPAAKDIFWGAIKEMSFEDARKILNGGDTAATEYFRAKTSEKLTAAFRPVVTQTMDQVGVTKQYKELVGKYQSVPFASAVTFDIDGYVVSKALDGLFFEVGAEERKIRKDPAARVTETLKVVFAGH